MARETRGKRKASLCERAKRRLAPAQGPPPHPIAQMLRACAERIDAGERWQGALGDYGLLLLPTADNRQRAGAARSAPTKSPRRLGDAP